MALVPALGLTLFLTISRGAHVAAGSGRSVLVLAARDRRAVDSTLLGFAAVALMAGDRRPLPRASWSWTVG